MMKTFNRFGLGTALAMAMVLGACSKKNTKDDGDTAAGDASMNVTDLGAGSTIPELPPIYFAYDSFTLDSVARSSLGGHAAWLSSNAGVNVQVEGHTDERGTTEYNLALGERRAAAIRDYLISQGIDAGRVSTISYGEERPAVSGASNEATWSRNRRGDFVLAN